MTYWQFRRRLYQHALKQWLNSLAQVSTGIVALFPMAMYALLFLPLLAMGVLADRNSSGASYYFTLWGYLLLSYCWIAMQKEALTAADNSFYDRSLPISPSHRKLTDIGLLLYAANVFIAAPVVVLAVMVVSHFDQLLTTPPAESFAQLYPLAALVLLTFYYCRSALGLVRPWLSLGVLPLLAMSWSEAIATPWLCLSAVAIAIVFERIAGGVKLPAIKLPDHFWRLFLQQDLSVTKPTMLRVVVSLLVLILGAIFIRNINAEASQFASAFFAVVLGVIIGSKLLELQALRERYQYYLSSIPFTPAKITAQALGYCLVFSLPFVLLILLFGLFSLPQWGLFLLIYVATQAGILVRPDFYLGFPLLMAAIVLVISLIS